MAVDSETPKTPRLVRDLMSVGVPTCGTTYPVLDLVRTMLEKELEGVVVLDEHGHAVGVVTWNELTVAYAHEGYEALTAEAVMRAELPKVPPDIPLAAAAQIMRDLDTRVLYMTHHAGGIEYPAAYLSCRHLLRHMAMRGPDDLKDLGIKAERESPLETFFRRRDEARRRQLPE
jgi:CBS domain-containing protein